MINVATFVIRKKKKLFKKSGEASFQNVPQDWPPALVELQKSHSSSEEGHRGHVGSPIRLLCAENSANQKQCPTSLK